MASKTVPRSKADSLQQALPVVLDAMQRCQARSELRTLLTLLVDSDAPAYRQRLAELLGTGQGISAGAPQAVKPSAQILSIRPDRQPINV